MSTTAPATVQHKPIALLTWHKPLLWLAFLMAALAIVASVGIFADDRVLTGLPIWAKPLKFALSILIYSLTLSWLLGVMPRWRKLFWWIGTVSAAFLFVEMVIIAGAVVAGTTSHFNVSSPFAATVWGVMAASIAIVWFATLLIAILMFWIDLGDPARNLAVRAAVVLALIGMGLAYLMVLPTEQQLADYEGIVGAHTVGVPDGGPGLPILGWSTVAGDLRIPHFVGMHGLQAIPLAALALEFAARRIEVLRHAPTRAALLWVIVALFTGVLTVLTVQALMGQSVVRPDATILAVSISIFAAAALAATLIVVAGRRKARRELETEPVSG